MNRKPVKLYRLAVNDGTDVTYRRGSLVAIARHILAMHAAGQLCALDRYYVSPVVESLPEELARK